MWSVRAGDVRVVSRLLTFGLPALAFYEAIPHPSVDMREQFADLFTVLQVSCRRYHPWLYLLHACASRRPFTPQCWLLESRITRVHFAAALQDGRDFADVVSPKLPFMFEMAASNRFYFHVIRHLVEGEAGMAAICTDRQ